MSGAKVDTGRSQQQVLFESFPEQDECNRDYGPESQYTSEQRSKIQEALYADLNHTCVCFRSLSKERLDLVEICAPWDSPLCAAVQELGGRAARLGLHNGYDLSTRSGMLKAAQFLRENRPRYAHFSPPCYPWSPMTNANRRTEQQVLRLEQERRNSKKILRNCRKLFEIQIHELQAQGSGVAETHASGEQPLRAQSWSEESWRAMTRQAGGRFRVDGCEHGLKNPKTGHYLQKSWGWFATCGALRRALEKKCQHSSGDHDLIQGDLTAGTATYPPGLCKAVAQCIMSPEVQWNEVCGMVGNLLESTAYANENPQSEQAEADEEDRAIAELLEAPPNEVPPNEAEDPEAKDKPVVTVQEARQSRILRKLRVIHTNLGHPSNDIMLRMLRDAKAPQEIIEAARKFQCTFCRTRGRSIPRRPAAPPKVTEKWHTVSVDTFWWHSPHKDKGQSREHAVGVSFLDEATDFHVAAILRTGPKKQSSISSAEFKEVFCRDWVRTFPTPKVLRVDDEGCFRDHGLMEWLSSKGVEIQVIAGESPWQNGKHSRHLETLKENMSLLASELPAETSSKEILVLSLGAKNELHQIRGYTPNQWAFGQAKGRLESLLQNGSNPAVQAGLDRKDDFSSQLKVTLKARETFLQADSRRRLSRAGMRNTRRTEVYEIGNLVYYWRKGRGTTEGTWFGPGRVVCVEKTSSDDTGSPGSVIWVVHGIVMYRCSPEQLRHVTQQVEEIDEFLSENLGPSELLSEMRTNMNYKDISQDMKDIAADHTMHEEAPTHPAQLQGPSVLRRVIGKQPPHHHADTEPVSEGRGDRPEQGGASEPSGREDSNCPQYEPHEPRAANADRREVRRPHSGEHSGGRPKVPHLAGRAPEAESSLRHAPGVHPEGPGEENRREGHHGTPEVDRETFNEHTARGRERGRVERPRHERDGAGGLAYPRREPRREGDEGQHERHDAADCRATGSGGIPEERDGTHAADVARDQHEDPQPSRELREDGRSRSRTPMRRVSFTTESGQGRCYVLESVPEDPEDCGNLVKSSACAVPKPARRVKAGCFSWQQERGSSGSNMFVNSPDLEAQFANFLASGEEVFEIDLPIAPRDVHLEKKGNQSRWRVNEKAKRKAEVCFRKLEDGDKLHFMQAMRSELGSYLEREAVEIATRRDIPKERVLPMRWVLTWKPLEDNEGQVVGQKPKARLIIKGFLDPDLLSLKRESPTLSSQNRNLLLAMAAQRRWKVQVGDIKTAFLNGDQTEESRNIGADPPEEVRKMLNMKPWELFRVLKAVYGLLHAPKVWYDKLAEVLTKLGWVKSHLEPCVFKLFNKEGELAGLIGCHVDDLVCCGEGEHYEGMLRKLQDAFPFGSWKDAMRETIMFCGCEMKQETNGTIKLSQERYAHGINEVPLSSARRQEVDLPLTDEERKQYRAVLGALSWRGTQSAPWLCASVSYLQGAFKDANVGDLCQLNKLVRLQKRFAEDSVVFHADIQRPMLVTFCDASWASRKDLSSQGGMLTVMCEASVLTGETSRFTPIAWQSRKLPRVARSSTSAEVQMASTSIDNHEFTKQIMIDWFNQESLPPGEVDQAMRQIESVMVCDSKNMYDALEKVESSGLHLEEKRTAIEVLSIKERALATNTTIRWTDSDQQLADGLSKNQTYDQLLSIFQKGRLSLVFDPEFVSAKKKRRAAHQHKLLTEAGKDSNDENTAKTF